MSLLIMTIIDGASVAVGHSSILSTYFHKISSIYISTDSLSVGAHLICGDGRANGQAGRGPNGNGEANKQTGDTISELETRVFENRVLKKTFGPKTVEITGGGGGGGEQ